jgi:hypothetical protein
MTIVGDYSSAPTHCKKMVDPVKAYPHFPDWPFPSLNLGRLFSIHSPVMIGTPRPDDITRYDQNSVRPRLSQAFRPHGPFNRHNRPPPMSYGSYRPRPAPL